MDLAYQKVVLGYTMRKLRYYDKLPTHELDLKLCKMLPEILHVFNSDGGFAGSVLGFGENSKNLKNSKNSQDLKIYYIDFS